GDFDRLPDVVHGRVSADGSTYGGAAHLLPDPTMPRVRTGPFFSAYLKVSEGCNHRCAFCIILKIRGRHQSRPLDSIVAEAEMLGQQISDRRLRRMRRERSGRAVRALVARIRDAIPGVALRTAFIVGFPGETDADFAELVEFVEETRFDRVGVFEYSPEENTD